MKLLWMFFKFREVFRIILVSILVMKNLPRQPYPRNSLQLGDLLYFPPLNDETMTHERKMKQMMFLQHFIGSFTGFQAGRRMSSTKQEDHQNLETVDKSYFVHLTLAHGVPNSIIYEEVVGISGPANHSLPHGNIDLLAFAHKRISLGITLYQ